MNAKRQEGKEYEKKFERYFKWGVRLIVFWFVFGAKRIYCFPGTIENGSFTNEFYPILQGVQLVFVAVGVAVVVYNFRMEKRLDGVARYGCVMALICTLINCMLILFFANIGIFFVGNIIAAVMILAGRE